MFIQRAYPQNSCSAVKHFKLWANPDMAWNHPPIVMSSASELTPYLTGNRGELDQPATLPDTVTNLKHLAIDEGDLWLPGN
jgi:hypothetical protein